MTLLNYHHLRLFRAVAHEGALTRAAERLNLSQSALSVQLRKLEDSLGHALFERRGRALRLTEAGRIALEHADAIFALGEELTGTLATAGRARQALRVGALATLSRNFVAGFLRPALGRPEVEVVLRSGGTAELLDALAALKLDLVLTNAPPATDAVSAFTAHRLAEQAVSLVGAPARLQGRPPLPRLLAEQPLIVPTAESGIRLGFDALVARLDVRPQIAAEVDDMAMMRLLAREDAGLAVLPPIAVADELSARLLVEAHRLRGITETFYAVTVARRFPNPLVPPLLKAGRAAPAGRPDDERSLL